jgi:hypothetical protein
MALKEVIVKFDHMKKLVKMHINLDENLSKLKNTLNNFLDLRCVCFMDVKINPRINVPRNIIVGILFQEILQKRVWLTN